ncbi:MAG: phospholipase D-like domain-containing protein [Pseudomonadales bacterium]
MINGRIALAGVLCAGVSLGVWGCLSLPNSNDAMAVHVDPTVVFEDGDGLVSAARGERILDGLDDAHDPADELLEQHLAFEQGLDPDNPLVIGNRLTLLWNGPETFRAMFDAIRSAQDHVNLETYIFGDDAIGTELADLLVARSAAGVEVNVVYDSIGGFTTPAAFFDRLRDAGVTVLEFNPASPLADAPRTWRLNNRDHRKLLIVDGHTAFTGGINIDASYSSAPLGRRVGHDSDVQAQPLSGWRDTHLRIEGPVVAEFQKLFLDTWTRQGASLVSSERYFPDIEAQGDDIVRAIGTTPDNPGSLMYLTLVSAIERATKRVFLTVAYFAPDIQLRKALVDAAARGVEVRVVLPSYSDSWAVFHLGRSHYAELLRGGVHVHERQGAVMHAKTITVDGVWSTIGSTNIDWRSFLHNDEINAVVLSRSFAEEMEQMFADDLRQSTKISLHNWQRRSLLLRLQERVARLAAYWL